MSIKTLASTLETVTPAITELAKFRYQVHSRELQYDSVITEQPLQIRLTWQADQGVESQSQIFSITMRTPGDDKALIVGLLLSEGIIGKFDQLESIKSEALADGDAEPEQYQEQAAEGGKRSQVKPIEMNSIEVHNQWEVKLNVGVIPDIKSLERFQVTYSSCGLCGTTSLKSLELKNPPRLNQDKHWLAFSTICAMPDIMRIAQAQFVQTGGSHAAALFDSKGAIVDVKEDIGRHNALDKLLGQRLMAADISNEKYCVVVSGRISFEIVQKVVMGAVAVLIAVGAPSDLAIQAAKRFNLTLIGFTTKSGFNLYHGDWRLLPLEEKCQKI
jgi:FdhD protein